MVAGEKDDGEARLEMVMFLVGRRGEDLGDKQTTCVRYWQGGTDSSRGRCKYEVNADQGAGFVHQGQQHESEVKLSWRVNVQANKLVSRCHASSRGSSVETTITCLTRTKYGDGSESGGFGHPIRLEV